MTPAGVWSAAALGAFHGLNPAMGWLFAVALGLQEHRRGAVLAALVPIAAGHAASVAVVGLALAAAGLAVPLRDLRLAAAVVLIAFGLAVWHGSAADAVVALLLPPSVLLAAIAVISGVSQLRRFSIPRAARTALIAALTVAAVLPPAIVSIELARQAGYEPPAGLSAP